MLNAFMKKAHVNSAAVYVSIFIGTTIGAFFAVRSSAKEVLPAAVAPTGTATAPTATLSNVSLVTKKVEEKIQDRIVSELADKVVKNVNLT